MKVQFITNVGTRDALEAGLDATKCTEGSVHDFPDDKARLLLQPDEPRRDYPLAREFVETPERDSAGRQTVRENEGDFKVDPHDTHHRSTHEPPRMTTPVPSRSEAADPKGKDKK